MPVTAQVPATSQALQQAPGARPSDGIEGLVHALSIGRARDVLRLGQGRLRARLPNRGPRSAWRPRRA